MPDNSSTDGLSGTESVSVVPYTKKWKLQFEEEKSRLAKVFADIFIAFHHIGSTSIPGCAAKPKVDILGVVPDITVIDRFDAELTAIGYQPKGEHGIRQRRFFTKGGQAPVNLHIFEDSDPETTRHLRFRDYLRNHPEAAEGYMTLKTGLAAKYPENIYQYCLGKEAFIKKIDYQAALNDPGTYLSRDICNRKHNWTRVEILNAMEANMHLHMTYFAKYVPSQSIIFEPDVTVVSSTIPDDTFNYVLGARFTAGNVREHVNHIVDYYQKRGIPFSWWLGERDTPDTLARELSGKGLTAKEDDIGMALFLDECDQKQELSDLSMQRVQDGKGLRDFAAVFAEIGGYANLYEDLFSEIPAALIADGASFEMYVGYLDGKPVVTGVLVLYANVAGVYYVMTTPQQRRKGFGTHVMQYLICRAKRKGYHLATLQASSEGRGLYERLGFRPLCRFVEYAYNVTSAAKT